MSDAIDLTEWLQSDELAARIWRLELELRIAKDMYHSTRKELDAVLGARLAHGETGSAAPAEFVTALRYGARHAPVCLEVLGEPVTLVLDQDGDGMASLDLEGWAWERVEMLLDEVQHEAAMLAGEVVLLRKQLPDPVAAMALRLDGRPVAVVSTRTRRQALRAVQSAGEAR